MELLEKDLTEKILSACFEVSNELGAGFLESVYKKALLIALSEQGVKAKEQIPLKVSFRNNIVGEFFADILVEDRIIIELKAVKSICQEHEAQVINYLKAARVKVGLLVNFGKPKLEWKRFVY
ncbi:MAG: NADH:ubiquinone oxidoreductase subunit 5 (chain L)/Multisubunit Na+/H+ antiporter, MnhA subunit [Candidatus Jettenia ecosi]|uniref:NADH:ubiquinone oxidoreductase subunit 5 (Chain L)/Multisubunit Na+/H+ antiporter, MnhA subunit n=1 Tax=Candidatus Jettenia ecosi TaxID=2494326 RepID=A0A533QC03_9BACT|nr:MAG: NADH:ubiquinone oxidoreductase subunit 5 (chain L)/Multisubunit Na+/H+ antiporter, MnhA subunit [Candidatus Jettenia ecosi]